jgi:hypothetical protein
MPSGIFLVVSIAALALFISLLYWGITQSRRVAPPVVAAPHSLPTGRNHAWVGTYDYKLSDFLPAPVTAPAKSGAQPGKSAPSPEAIALPSEAEAEEELRESVLAELNAEADHYEARIQAESATPAESPRAAETYDNPFEEPAPTATDKHNRTVKNELRARRVAAASRGRLAATGDLLTKSRPA